MEEPIEPAPTPSLEQQASAHNFKRQEEFGRINVAARSMPIEGLFDAIRTAAPSKDASLHRMQAVANLLDTAFVIPGTKQRVGIDAIIGLVPGVGDVITTILSSYIIWEARNLGVSRFALTRMLANLGIHAAVGSLPLVGDVFDAFFRVNQRNMRIVQTQMERRARRELSA